MGKCGFSQLMGPEEQKAHHDEFWKEVLDPALDKKKKEEYKKVFTSANRLKAALRSYDGDLKEVAVVNGVWKDSYAKLNSGLLRMTVGNQLQMKLDACQPVRIGKVEL